MWRVVAFFGALLWLLTIAASGAMNAVAGYGLGRSATEGLIFAALGIVADGWKALAPITIVSLVRANKLVIATVAFTLWAVCFTVAVAAAIGLAAQNRSAATGGQEAISASFKSVSRELDEIAAQRARSRPGRSVSEIEAAIGAVLARPIAGAGTVGTVSGQCGIDTGRTRTACAEIATLRIELAAAVEAERIDRRKVELEQEQRRLSQLGGQTEPDPQARLLARLLRGLVSIQDVGLGLVLVLVGMVEIVSAFAPMVITEYVRAELMRARTAGSTPPASKATVIELQPVGDVFEYMADCIRPAPSARVPVAAVVLSYRQWCSARSRTAMSEPAFLQEIERICRDELKGRVRRQRDHFIGFGLTAAIGPPTTAGP